jgi:chromosome partitioning protein
MPRIIAVTSPKGGVGKTTTVINLAASLAIARKNVLIVDTDPQGSAAEGFGLGDEKIDRWLLHALENEKSISQAMYPAIFDNLKIIPCRPKGDEQEQRYRSVTKDLFLLKSVLKKLLLHSLVEYDFVIIDTPPIINHLTINALVAANSFLIPLQSGLFSLGATKKLFEAIKNVRNMLNPGLEPEGILLTFFEKNTRLSRRTLESIPADLGKYLFDTIVYKNTAIGYSVFMGRPVALVDFYSSGAQAYFSLAGEVIQKNNGSCAPLSEVFYI